MINRINIFLIGLLITFAVDITAQQYPITHYTQDRGLPGNQTWAIAQDGKGYMWFATSAGLVKYNGRDSKVFTNDDGLLGQAPYSLNTDKKGDLYAGYSMGISRIRDSEIKNWKLRDVETRFGVFADSYDRVWIFSIAYPSDVYYLKNDSLHNFSSEYSFGNQAFHSAAEDKGGAIYFMGRGRDSKLYKFFAREIKEIKIDELAEIVVLHIFFDKFDNLVLCSNKGVGLINTKNLDNNPNIKWILRSNISYGFETKEGKYWFSSFDDGLYRLMRLDSDSEENDIINIRKTNGLNSNVVQSIYEDREGNVWIAHQQKGISKISTIAFKNYTNEDGLEGDIVLWIKELNGNIMLATGAGIFKIGNNGLKKINDGDGWHPDALETRQFGTLLGGAPGLFRLSGNSELKLIGFRKQVVTTLFEDHSGAVWIGTQRGLFSQTAENIYNEFNYDAELSKRYIYKMVEVDNKHLYLGTDKGLYIIENGTNNFGSKKIIKPEFNGILSQRVSDLLMDGDSTLLIATASGILVSNDLKSIENFEEIKIANVVSIYIDSKKNLWAGTFSGLYLLKKEEGTYKIVSRYTQKESLVTDEFAFTNNIIEDIRGKLYFGTFGGITVLDPAEERNIFIKPFSYINNIQINEEVYTEEELAGTKLEYNQNKIIFNCESISFFNEDDVRFEYYLSPLEKEWSNNSTNPTISYGYLEPNDYTFYVRSVNQFGTTSDPQSISFIITAPFWRQTWFVGLAIVLLVAAGYQVNRVRRNQIRKRNLVLQRIVEEKTKDLKDSKGKIEEQYTELLEVQEELVEKRELEKAHSEIQLLKERLAKENIYLRERHGSVQAISSIIGRSGAIQEVRTKVAEIAVNDSTVLLTGETGVGKNLIAEAIHGLSKRKERALITVNCAAIPDTLVESELFGHEKGSFTGANERREGKFEVADGSTIFLDEIGDMPLAVQAKVLNVFQSRTFTRVGGNEQISTDVRIIAATNHDLALLVKEGKFRQDLYYRINVYSINIPSLRERQEDIEPIAKYFIDKYAEKLNKKISAVTKSALKVLLNYDYPGNIRELENIIHRAVIICKNGIISDQEIIIQTGIVTPENGNGLKDIFIPLEDMERKYIMKVLAKTGGKISGSGGAAEILGMPRSTLRSRMEKLGIKGGGE